MLREIDRWVYLGRAYCTSIGVSRRSVFYLAGWVCDVILRIFLSVIVYNVAVGNLQLLFSCVHTESFAHLVLFFAQVQMY